GGPARADRGHAGQGALGQGVPGAASKPDERAGRALSRRQGKEHRRADVRAHAGADALARGDGERTGGPVPGRGAIVTLLDHLLMFVLAAALPVEGYFEFRALVGALKRADESARARMLLRTIVLEWGLVLALLAGWQAAGRPWTELGLTL